MTSPSPALHKNACSLCARRKVKCDKGEPCANCLKAQAQCLYEVPAPPRPRKRAADDELFARLARYEDLMRKHNVDFTHYANTWVSSGLEMKLKDNDSHSPVSHISAQAGRPISKISVNVEKCLWSNLSSELKHPPVQSLRHRDDPLLHPTPSLQLIYSSTQPALHDLHPEPRHIYRYWQIFVETVNPFIKIVHVPTLQQRILDASWDLANVPKPLTAMLFAIYTLAVTSLSSEECHASFGETRDTLLSRYRVATVRALIAADFLITREVEVLQAFVLFLFADPESELTSSLTGAAIRLGEKMGLCRETPDPKISFFEKEMRVRLWWQLYGLHSRTRANFTPGKTPPLSEFGQVRLPLNVNDADLHPNMTEPPIEHSGPTEMLCVLMKFEVFHWLRSSPTAAKVFENIIQGPVRGKMSMELEDEAINEIEAIYREKYFRNSDKRIPLHGLTHAMANLNIAYMRFKAHHPWGRAAVSGGEVYMTQEESDMLFDAALTSLEMVNEGVHSKFSSHLFAHMTSKFQMDTFIYVISDLRQRSGGERVTLAWKLIEDLCNEHPELIDEVDNTFFVALGNLILEAWETRRKELLRAPGVREADVTPSFIQLLWGKRQTENVENVMMPTMLDPPDLDTLGWADDWEYWNDFLRL
ncbi:uncharacterized protein Z518_01206 [Rhinocladiella mackenziei CBS 650.93]|uniref:Zn(2)-C6 fungal-type domain-containing protein n=1 Tax=Rhinocladiella mackenziei CBS 650.93 TaxID=1442369 RepID=A0A0D2JKY6_9EURO|nr:uncharacterized protein Z518_01206 [Rhinocladiella mackenziei CBS 650.93]KIX10125.1 hypothetical protein Z518_01206 [Rhinocladiella mackenziei CBS 650.93]